MGYLSLLADTVVQPGETNGFCASTAVLWQFVGIVLMVLKIVIPIILIILGMIDLGKAVVSSEDKAVSKSATKLLWRLIAAIIIFFVPTIVSAIFALMGSFQSELAADYKICRECIEHPRKGSTSEEGTCLYYVG